MPIRRCTTAHFRVSERTVVHPATPRFRAWEAVAAEKPWPRPSEMVVSSAPVVPLHAMPAEAQDDMDFAGRVGEADANTRGRIS